MIGSTCDFELELSEEVIKRTKRVGRLLCLLVVLVAFLTLFINSTERFSFYIGTGVIQVAFYLMITIIKHKNGLKQDDNPSIKT